MSSASATSDLMFAFLCEQLTAGFVAFTSDVIGREDSLLRLMDKEDGEAPGTIFTVGRIYNPATLSWHTAPSRDSGETLRSASDVAEHLFHRYGFDAVKQGTGVKRIPPVAAYTSGKLLVWKRSDRAHYVLQDLVPLDGIDVHSFVEWTEDTSFILWLSWEWLEDKTTDRIPDLEDVHAPGAPRSRRRHAASSPLRC